MNSPYSFSETARYCYKTRKRKKDKFIDDFCICFRKPRRGPCGFDFELSSKIRIGTVLPPFMKSNEEEET